MDSKTISTQVSKLAIAAMGGSDDARNAYINCRNQILEAADTINAYINSRNQILEAADTIKAIESTPAGQDLIPQNQSVCPSSDVYKQVRLESGLLGEVKARFFGVGHK